MNASTQASVNKSDHHLWTNFAITTYPTFLVLYFNRAFLPLLEDTFSEWISYDVWSRHTGVSWIRCSLNQYLSGLAFAKDPTADVYVWSARCTNLPVGYTKRELFCWNSNATLVQGSNGSLSLPGESVVIERIKISYEDYYVNNFYHTRFNYVFCLVIDGM